MLQKLMNWLRELIVTLKCKFLNRDIEEYPVCILPYSHYRKRINIEDLSDKENCVIVRRSNKSSDDSFTEVGTLREDVIFAKDIPSLSMNLYGSRFTNSHLGFRCFDKAMELWDGIETIKLSNYTDCYSIISECSPVYFYLNTLHNRNFPYYRADDKETQKILKELNINPLSVNGKVEFAGSATVIHTPNKLNYWHVELEIKDARNTSIKYGKPEWIKSAVSLAYSNLIAIEALKVVPSVFEIPTDTYSK